MHTKVTRLTPLHRLARLTWLDLDETKVPEREIQLLMKAIPDCLTHPVVVPLDVPFPD